MWQIVLARRSAEILSLELRDICLLPPGGVAVQVRRIKGWERRAIIERLTLCVTAAPAGVPRDLAIKLLLRLLARLKCERAPPSRLIFSVAELDHNPTFGDLSPWLLVAVARIAARPPPGALYSSHSGRSGGASALHVCSVSRPGFARLLGHSRNNPAVDDSLYVKALAQASLEAYWLVGRYTLSSPAFVAASHAPSLGQSAVSRAAKWDTQLQFWLQSGQVADGCQWLSRARAGPGLTVLPLRARWLCQQRSRVPVCARRDRPTPVGTFVFLAVRAFPPTSFASRIFRALPRCRSSLPHSTRVLSSSFILRAHVFARSVGLIRSALSRTLEPINQYQLAVRGQSSGVIPIPPPPASSLPPPSVRPTLGTGESKRWESLPAAKGRASAVHSGRLGLTRSSRQESASMCTL